MIRTIEKFGAEWCGPCKVLETNLRGISGVDIVKFDADQDPELFEVQGIKTVPVMVFKDEHGNIVETVTGLRTKAEIQKIIDKYAELSGNG